MNELTTLAWIGPGQVGRRSLDRLSLWRVPDREIRLVAIARRGGTSWGAENLLDTWEEVPLKPSTPESLPEMIRFLAEQKGTRILVDTSSLRGLSPHYKMALEMGINVVTAVKGSVVSDFATFRDLCETARLNRLSFLYRTCVGAGLGLASMVREHVACDDCPIEIGGVLGGTLSFLCNSFMQSNVRFSALVYEAMRRGYTDPPDPRLDLSGRDSANKVALLMWEMGLPVKVEDINYEPLLSLPQDPRDLDFVMLDIEAEDGRMAGLKAEALRNGKRLRFPFSIRGGKASMKLTAVGSEDPSFHLDGADNLLWITTPEHRRPRVMIGEGAGPDWTSLGVQMDIAKIMRLH